MEHCIISISKINIACFTHNFMTLNPFSISDVGDLKYFLRVQLYNTTEYRIEKTQTFTFT